MFEDFKKFLMRGNVIDLAVGVVIGAAFGKIVSSFVSDLLMPPIGLLLGKVDFSNLFIDLSGHGYPTLAAAKAAGAPTVNYGVFANNVLDFLIIGFSVFLVVKVANWRVRREETKAAEQAKPALTTSEALLVEIRDLLKSTADAEATLARRYPAPPRPSEHGLPS